jgi:hypothetical protein
MRRWAGLDHTSRSMRLILAVALLAVACDGSTPFGPGIERQRWEAREPFAYRFNVRRSCFCGFDVMRYVTIEVVGGIVQRRYFADNGEDIPEALVDVYPSIDELFDELQEIADSRPHHLEITYDDEYGFPATVSVDRIENMADDEFSLEVTGFQERLMALAARAAHHTP